MTKEKDFYRELPAGYREDKVVDATDKKFMSVLYTALAVVMIITYVIVDFIDCGRITLFDAFFNRPTESDYRMVYKFRCRACRGADYRVGCIFVPS